MTTTLLAPQQSPTDSLDAANRSAINTQIEELMASLPDKNLLTPEERRGNIARYTSVLEGNFIYWMTATLIATQAEEARPIILENLHEECRDAHPDMLRRFAIGAGAFPTSADALAVNNELASMRRFLGKLSPVQSLASMALFEGFIQRFMSYLADLAVLQGSTEMEYTDVHGVCDIAHTEGLFNALAVEQSVNPLGADQDLFEGVHILRALIEKIVFNRPDGVAS